MDIIELHHNLREDRPLIGSCVKDTPKETALAVKVMLYREQAIQDMDVRETEAGQVEIVALKDRINTDRGRVVEQSSYRIGDRLCLIG